MKFFIALAIIFVLTLLINRQAIRTQVLLSSTFCLYCIFLLSGCTNAAPKPQRYDVPVIVGCVKDRPARPTYLFEQTPTPKTDLESAEQVRILWKDKEAAVKYGDLLEVATAGCPEQR